MQSKTLRRLGIGIVLAGALVTLAACLPVPLGDPAKAVADSRFVAAWHWKEDGGRNNVVVIRPWDEHTFVVDAMGFDGELETPAPKFRMVYKGWLADVKGKTFINLQQIDMVGLLRGEKRQKLFLVAKVEIAGDKLTASGLDPAYDPFKNAATTTDLEKVVAQNMDDVKMWVKPIVATKLGDAQMESLEKLAKKFEEMKVE
jgi:hypothetical protein